MNAESVKARLKNHAKATERTLQDVLTIYGLERTMYRISISSYADKFTLKGGIFLYALLDGKFMRATTDIDLLAQGTSNDLEVIKGVLKEILQIEVDDALRYDMDSLEVISITEFKEYHGVNAKVRAYLNKTRVDVSLDIGFGDVVYPKSVKMEFPVLLDMEAPTLYAYSMDSVVAEKFEAFVQLGYANSRYKDFYDIYILASTQDFDGAILKNAITETFQHRGTGFHDIVAFEDEFIEDSMRQSRWKSFIKQKKAMVDVEFGETMKLLKAFLQPIVKAILEGDQYSKIWDHTERTWL